MASSPSDLLRTPLGQFGLGAIVLVVAGALLFTLIGAVSGPDDADGPAIASTPDTPSTSPTPTATTSAPVDTPSETGTPSETATTPTEAEPTPTETTASPEPPAIDPGSVTIQVLDASDDAADQDAVVACLGDAGYDSLITGNRAVRTYDTTTVFYTPGEDNQIAAQQVAGVLGIGSVEEKPSNLSGSVPVHVVTGVDGSDRC
jgi:cytoskeletal protein RodZ